MLEIFRKKSRIFLGGICAIISLSLVSIHYSCSWEISKRHEFVVGTGVNAKGEPEKVRLDVVEEGRRYLFVVDGETRRTHFSKGEYTLVKRSKEIPLGFLTADNPVELWDNFVKFGDFWMAIDITGSLYRGGEPSIKVARFNENGLIEKYEILFQGIDCRITDVAIGKSGKILILQNRIGKKCYVDLMGKYSSFHYIETEEYNEILGDAVALSNEGISLDMGSFGEFGVWCQ